MMRLIAVLCGALAIWLWAGPSISRTVTISLGDLEVTGGKIVMSVREEGGKKEAMVFVSDRHIIKTNLLLMGVGDLRKLRALTDAALAELDPSAAAATVEDRRNEQAIARAASDAAKLCRSDAGVSFPCLEAVHKCRLSSKDFPAVESCLAELPAGVANKK